MSCRCSELMRRSGWESCVVLWSVLEMVEVSVDFWSVVLFEGRWFSWTVSERGVSAGYCALDLVLV